MLSSDAAHFPSWLTALRRQSVSVTGIAYNLTSLAYLAFPLGLCGAPRSHGTARACFQRNIMWCSALAGGHVASTGCRAAV